MGREARRVVDHADPTALYVQLADILREQIAAGDYRKGDLLPSEKELCDLHGLAHGTVRKSLAKLADEGLVRPLPARGVMVL